MKRKLLTSSLGLLLMLVTFAAFGQNPMAPAQGFTVFARNNVDLGSSNLQGPLALGGDLKFSFSPQVGSTSAGSYSSGGNTIGLLVGGKIDWTNSAAYTTFSMNNGYVKIGNCTNTTVNYNTGSQMEVVGNNNSKIQLGSSATTFGVSSSSNPVCATSPITFSTAFTTLSSNATGIAGNANTVSLYQASNASQSINISSIPSGTQAQITLANGTNFLNITGANLNNISQLTFNNNPDASKVLVVNVNVAGAFSWNMFQCNNLTVSGSNAYILFNFYNGTTSIALSGQTVYGAILAPDADVTKSNYTSVHGQIAAKSYNANNGGGTNYNVPFVSSVSGAASSGNTPTVANFTTNTATQCLSSNSYSFTNTSTGSGTLTYLWNFGDNTTSTTTNPTKTYSAAGTYTVKLKTTGTAGSDSTTQTVTVNASPTSGFTVNNATQNLSGNSFVFTSNGSATGNTYSWTFGDGTTSTSANPTKTYTSAGTYTVTRVATTTSTGCSVTNSTTITVNGNTASTGSSPTAPALGFNVFLQNGATLINNETEGGVAMGGNLRIQGGYQVSTNSIGTFTVNNQPVTLVVGGKIDYANSNSSTLQVNSNGYVKIGDSTGADVWYVDNNGASSPIRITPDGNYNGTPKISLSANASNLGNVSATNNPVFQSNVINFTTAFGQMQTYATNIAANNTNNVTLYDPNMTSTYPVSSVPSGSQVKVNLTSQYNFLNITGANLNNITSLTYQGQAPDASHIMVINVNASGTFNWNVFNSAGIGANAGAYVFFNFYNTTALNIQGNGGVIGTVYAPNADITKSVNQSNIDGQVIAKSYYHSGGENHPVYFTTPIPGSAGGNSVAAPIASFTNSSTTQCLTGNAFTFTNTTTGSGTITYSWNYGDGTSATTTNGSKTYTTAGTYTVILTATNAGGSDTATQVVTVSAAPTTGFAVNNSTQAVTGNSFTFTTSTPATGNTYLWRLGDGTTATTANVTKTYAATGTYTVKQIITNAAGCKDSTTQTVTVVANTVASFTTNTATQCLAGNSYTFTSTSTGAGTLTYLWSFGDGTTATTANATKSYTTAGTYTVKLKVTGTGDVDSTTQTVTVVAAPATGFSVNNSSQTLSGNSFVFTTTGSTAGNTYLWRLGDGTTATTANVTKSYTAAGTYSVKQIVTNANGCKDSVTQTVTVISNTGAAFTVNNSTQCLVGNSFTFTNASTGAGTLTYTWKFGDGTTATTTNATKSYTAAGTYTVKLIATGNGGSDSTTQTITVVAAPATGFTVNNSTQALSGNSFVFTTSGSTSGNTYSWNFGDGTTGTGANTSKSYTTVGTYTVKQIVTNANGCKDSTTQTVSVIANTVAGFTTTNAGQCLTGNSFTFTNTSTGAGTLTYVWNFGDGTTATTANATKSYTTAGTYTVKLKTTGNGGVDSTTQTITVYAQPSTGFTVNSSTQALSGNSFVFTTTGTTAGNTYLWRLGDGTTSTATNPTKSYTAAGTYTVKQIVTTANGCKDSTTQTVTVVANTVASFTTNTATQCLAGNSYSFTNTSTGNGTLSYLWSFGDGTTATTANATKSYTTAGTYTVKLKVTGTYSTDSTTQTVTVNAAPATGFSVNNGTQALSGNSFVFTTTGTTAGNTYAWSFGDGSTSTSVNPTKSYTSTGTYTVKQVVTASTGCKDSTTQTVTVIANTAAGFTVNTNSQCFTGNNFSFTNTSTGAGSLSYLWNFGDGTTSTSTNPTRSYTAAGTYTVKLKTTGNGGVDSTTLNVTVNPQPATGFTVNAASQSLSGNNFVFTTTTQTTGNTYLWRLGDGTTSTATNPSKTYSATGTYTVKQIITNASGCKDSTTMTVTVVANTAAAFTVNASSQCLTGNSFVMTNASSGAGSLSYLWNFGDGTTSTATNPSKSYTSAGTYTVKLKVTGSGGVDSTTQTVTVNAIPVATFTVNNATQTISGNSFAFTATTTGNTYSWNYGDGTTGTGASTSKTYAATGTYTVKLVVTSATGCKDSTTQNVTVNPNPTVAGFTVNNNNQCLTGNNFAFTNTSTGTAPFSYSWNFGDGTAVSTAINAAHSYTTAGTFTVTLTTTGAAGSNTATQTVTVNAMPSVGFTVNADTQNISTNNFVFTTTGSTAGKTYSWNFGDGTTSATANPSKVYTLAGTYTVKQVVTNASGCKDSATRVVTVKPDPTIAGFAINAATQCLAGNSFVMTNSSTGSAPITYSWNFGDGTTSTVANPTKTYATIGNYTITLTVTGAGGTQSTTKTANVVGSPSTGFTVNNAAQTLNGNSFVFTTTGSTSGNTYAWKFGDDSTANGANVTHHYAAAGNYNVIQIVTNAGGCKDSATQVATVYSDGVGSGNDGGLESDGSLGDLVTTRDFNRMKFGKNVRIDYNKLPVFSIRPAYATAKETAGGLELTGMVPKQLEAGDIVRVTTPSDLLSLTAAVEVLSVDYVRNTDAKAVVLGIKTLTKAYNHTKSICDRFRGGTLLGMEEVNIQGYHFTRFQLRQDDGSVEYAIAFVAGKKAGRNSYNIQTNWLISEYASEDTMYNFQVWAMRPDYTNKLASDILDNLKADRALQQTNSYDPPKAYITYGVRKKDNLVINVNNTTNITNGKITFEEKVNERSGYSTRSVDLTLVPGKTNVFAIPIKDGYEYEGRVFLDGQLVDEVYMADGNWGLDYDSHLTSVPVYKPNNNYDREYKDDEFPLYRNVTLQANSTDYLTLYKALRSGTEPTNLTDYNSLKFFAKGKGKVEVTLTRDSIIDWNSQYRTVITLDEAGKDYTLSFEDFVSSKISKDFNPKDIKTLNFTFSANAGTMTDFNFFVDNVAFSKAKVLSKKGLTSKAISLSPNPSHGKFQVQFVSTDDRKDLEVIVSDITGKVVYTQPITAVMGNNAVSVELNHKFTSATLLFVTIKGQTLQYESQKILID